MTETEIEQRDELVAEAITSGRSLRAVRKEFGLSVAELDAALERCWPIDLAARLRMIRTDGGKLDRMIEVFFQKAIAGDVNSATLVVKALERKAELFALNAAQRIDLQVIRAPEQPSRFDRIYAAIMQVKHGPDWQPQDANGGDGAVGVLSDLSENEHKP